MSTGTKRWWLQGSRPLESSRGIWKKFRVLPSGWCRPGYRAFRKQTSSWTISHPHAATFKQMKMNASTHIYTHTTTGAIPESWPAHTQQAVYSSSMNQVWVLNIWRFKKGRIWFGFSQINRILTAGSLGVYIPWETTAPSADIRNDMSTGMEKHWGYHRGIHSTQIMYRENTSVDWTAENELGPCSYFPP